MGLIRLVCGLMETAFVFFRSLSTRPRPLPRPHLGGVIVSKANMEYRVVVDPFKAIFVVSEVIQNNVLKHRGIACAVNFKGKIFLVTSSSAVEADQQKNLVLIAERYSRRHFHDYRLEVSVLSKLGYFTFLKINKECEFGKVGRSWVISLNLELPSSESKASQNQFRGMQEFELQFKRDGNSTNIEVISEKPTELTSILGAPIIIENKEVKETHSGRFSVIGVVGLTSDSKGEKLCPYYLDLLDENTLGKFVWCFLIFISSD